MLVKEISLLLTTFIFRNNMKILPIFLLFCYITCVTCKKGKAKKGKQSPTAILEKIKSGFIAGSMMMDAIKLDTEDLPLHEKLKKSKGFKNKARGLAGKVGPYLGSVGGLLSIVTSILPSSQSAELSLMKEKFSEIDDKFDQVFNQFAVTKRLITKLGLYSQFSRYELDILSMSKLIKYYVENPNGPNKEQILYQFKSGAANKILIGTMKSGSLTANIPKAAMEFTNYDRFEVQLILDRISALLIKGMEIEVAYQQIASGKEMEFDEMIRGRWERKMTELGEHLVAVDDVLVNSWEKAARADINAKVQEWGKKKNNELADELRGFLSNKYYWKDWHVLVFNSKLKDDEYLIKTCTGSWFLKGKQEKNIVISGVDKDQNMNGEGSYRFKFMALSSCITGRCIDSYTRDLDNCNFVDFGRIKTKNADIAHSGPSNRLQKRDVKDWQSFTFS